MKEKLLRNFWFTVFAVGAMIAFIAAFALFKGYPLHLTMLISGLLLAAVGALAIGRAHLGNRNGN